MGCSTAEALLHCCLCFFTVIRKANKTYGNDGKQPQSMDGRPLDVHTSALYFRSLIKLFAVAADWDPQVGRISFSCIRYFQMEQCFHVGATDLQQRGFMTANCSA